MEPFKTVHTLLLFVLIVALIAVGWNLHTRLQNPPLEKQQLREILRSQMTCAPVRVICECPSYDEGWEDALFVEGCDPDAVSLGDVELLCSEFNEYGYAPHC